MTIVKDKPIPAAVRREVLRRAHGRCESRGREAALELHHLTYETDHGYEYSTPIFGRETADDLRALCGDCHLGEHIGPDDDFYEDPEECEAEWDYYDHMMGK